MSLKTLKKLACEAFNLLLAPDHFRGFARACQVFGVEVYPTVGGNGVIVRSPKFWVERFRDRDGVVRWTIFQR